MKRPSQDIGSNPEPKRFVKVEGAPETEGDHDPNEDAYIYDEKDGLFGVFDGMGGQGHGNIASGIAREYVTSQAARLNKLNDPQELGKELANILIEANKKIVDDGRRTPDHQGMGTTASVAKLLRLENGQVKLIIAHVGDSRIYRADSLNNLEQVTTDDDVLKDNIHFTSEEVEHLRWALDVKAGGHMTAREHQIFRRRNEIANSLGHLDAPPEVSIIDIHPGDKVLLTSDGIHDNLRSSEIEGVFDANKGTKTLAKDIIKATQSRANSADPRHKYDDFTAVAIKIDSVPVDPEKEHRRQLFQTKKRKIRDLMQLVESDFREFTNLAYRAHITFIEQGLEDLANDFREAEFQPSIQKLGKEIAWVTQEAKDLVEHGDTVEQRKQWGRFQKYILDIHNRIHSAETTIKLASGPMWGKNAAQTEIDNIKYLISDQELSQFAGVAAVPAAKADWQQQVAELEALLHGTPQEKTQKIEKPARAPEMVDVVSAEFAKLMSEAADLIRAAEAGQTFDYAAYGPKLMTLTDLFHEYKRLKGSGPQVSLMRDQLSSLETRNRSYEQKELELRQMAEELIDPELDEELRTAGILESEMAEEKAKKFFIRKREEQILKLIEQLRQQS